jgi:hypothetical protein
MQKTIFCLLLLLSPFSINAEELKPIAKQVYDSRNNDHKISTIKLLNQLTNSRYLDASLISLPQKALVYEVDFTAITELLASKASNITFLIPQAGEPDLTLELFQHEIFTPDFAVVSATTNSEVTVKPGLHYWGIINGDINSLAAISIFENEISGIISSPSRGNFVLGKLKNDTKLRHVFYNENDLNQSNTSECYTIDDGITYNEKQIKIPAHRSLINCIRLYWEVNYDIFFDKGNIVNTTNYITSLFSESALIYFNDNIPVSLSQVYVWDIPSPYSGTSSFNLLSQFQAYRNIFNGDLANLLGYAGGGGIAAGFTGICNSNPDQSQCYSGISSSFNNVPVYSWSVEVLTHEQGHLMGSRHTHACVWNGNNTAIDGCAPAAGYQYEGNCSGAPLPGGGGTIMSYCHLVPVGINFSMGFGSQPAAVIINNYNNAICLSSCSSTLCLAPVNPVTSSVTIISAVVDWDSVPGALSYNIQYRIAGTVPWQTANTLVNTYTIPGLSPGINYEWQVQTVCNGDSSILTSSVFFVTIPLVCDPPLVTVTSALSAVSATLRWDVVQGSISYEIQWRVTGTPAWSSALTADTFYTISSLIPSTEYEWSVQTSCAGGDSSAFTNPLVFTTYDIGDPVTITLQPDGSCGKDALIANCVNCGYYNVNFGNVPEIDAIAWTNGGNVSDGRSLMQFDFTSIPQGSSIQSAFLSLYYNPVSSNPGHSQLSGSNDAVLYEIALPWDEQTVTWTNQPVTTTLNQVMLPASSSSTQNYTNIDITGMVQDFVNDPSINYGMLLKLVNESAYRSLVFASSDHPDSSLHPKVEITYAPAVSECYNLQYASCMGVDAMVGSCISCGYDTSNFGGVADFAAIAATNGGNTSNARSLIKWDLSFIPTNAIVSSADLSLFSWLSPSNGQHVNISGANDAYLNKIISPWDEYIVTWNTMPAVSTSGQVYMPASTSANQDYINYDVTSLVQDMVSNPITNYGLLLQLVNEQFYRQLIFASSDNPDPLKHPLLEICYLIPIGISETAIEDFNIYQDNFSGDVIINFPANVNGQLKLNIYNAEGKLVNTQIIKAGNSFTKHYSFAHGIYFYELAGDGILKRGKLIY